jgi:hypothetical protein
MYTTLDANPGILNVFDGAKKVIDIFFAISDTVEKEL